MMKHFVFFAGLVVYLVLQLYVVVKPMVERSEPVEVDDTYGYILKAAEMENDPFQGGIALSDLRQQVSRQTGNYDAAAQRFRQGHRVFTVYHPAHSLVLLSLHKIGIPWSSAYETVQVAGCVFLGLAVAVWLYSLVGAGAAGCALLILAPAVFAGQGLHYVVPTNLALGIAMLTWLAATKNGRARFWGMLGGTALMLVMHAPAGKMYAVIAILICLMAATGLKDRKAWYASIGPFLLVVAAALLPLIVKRPTLAVGSPPLESGYNYARIALDNVRLSLYLIKEFSVKPIAFMILFLVGLVKMPTFHRRIVFGELIIFGALVVGSVFYSFPGYEGTLTTRVYIPLALVAASIVGHGVWSIYLSAVSNLKNEARLQS